MTVLRHQLLGIDGNPVAGHTAQVMAYQPEDPAKGYRRTTVVSAVSDDDGFLEWKLPRPKTGDTNPVYVVIGIESQRVLVTVPTSVSTATVVETRTGTLPLSPGAQNGTDLVTEQELATRLAGLTPVLPARLSEEALRADFGTQAADSASPLRTELAKVFGAGSHTGRALRNTAVAMGDSNTVNPLGSDIATPPAANNATGWFQLMCALSKGRIEHAGLFAKAGTTVAQCRDAKLPAILALNPRPGACFINLGTNDADWGTNGSGFNLAAATAAYVDILTQLMAAEILPIICLPLPNGNTAGSVQINLQTWHKRLRDLASYYRVPLVDFYTPVIDPATGGILPAYAADTKHVSALGRRVLASAALAQSIANFFPPTRIVTAKSTVDPSNLIPSGRGLYLNSTGWSAFGDTANAAVSSVPPQAADGLVGNWHQIVHSGSALYNRQMSAVTTPGWSAGDVVVFTGRIQTSGIEAAKASGLTPSIYPRVAFRNSSGAIVAYASALLQSPQFEVDIADGLFRVQAIVDPSWAQYHIELTSQGFSAGFPGTIRYGELTLRNHTQLGTYTG